MASLYMRGRFFWVAYWVNGKQRQKSLGTKNETVARNKLKRLEYELAIGDLQKTSHLRLATILEEFCQHLRAKHPHKSCANDVSRLSPGIYFVREQSAVGGGRPAIHKVVITR